MGVAPLFCLVATLMGVTTGSSYTYGVAAMRNGNNWYNNNNRNNGNNYGQQRGSCDPNRCQCSLQYIPFCASNGQTYANRCLLQCAQNCDAGLRVNFEGVCPERYVHNDGSRRGPGAYNPLPGPVQVGTRPIIVVDKNNAYDRNNDISYGYTGQGSNRATQYYSTPRPRPSSTNFEYEKPQTTTRRPYTAYTTTRRWDVTLPTTIRPWYETTRPGRPSYANNINQLDWRK